MTIVLPEDILIKIERAEELVRQIDDVCRGYANTVPASLVPVADPTPLPDGRVAWGVKARIVAPPRELRALVGDAVNNLRSSLEYLARALVVTNEGTPVDSGRLKTQFPISYGEAPSTVSIGGGVPAEALDIVRSVQPGPDGIAERHPLALLRELSNQDKHRAPMIVAGGTPIPAAFSIRTTNPEENGFVSPLLKWLADGDWAYAPAFPFDSDKDIVVDSTVKVVVSLPGEGPVMPALADDLDYLLRYVRGVLLPQFAKFFLGPWPSDVLTQEDPIDPMVTALESAVDHEQILADTRRIAQEYPLASDGYRHFIMFKNLEFMYVDARLDD